MRDRFETEKCLAIGNGRMCGGKFEKGEERYDDAQEFLNDVKAILNGHTGANQGRNMRKTPCGLCTSKLMKRMGIKPKPIIEMNFESGEIKGAENIESINGMKPHEYMMRERNSESGEIPGKPSATEDADENVRTIWKFELEVTGVQHVKMPWGSNILTVQEQHGKVCLWCDVNPSEERIVHRCIHIAGTGHSLPKVMTYIGSVQQRQGHLVWHVFEDCERLVEL